jgi:hypothetical protein
MAMRFGSLNNDVTMEVAGVAGGSASSGTIAASNAPLGEYIYTAPATMPVLVTVEAKGHRGGADKR